MLKCRVAAASIELAGQEERMKALVVALVLERRPEEAIEVLSKWYKVTVPRLGVGVTEGKTKGIAAVYSGRRREILAANREYLYDPFVIVHEFYHHLRTIGGTHKGTERQADLFANGFIAAYRSAAAEWASKTDG